MHRLSQSIDAGLKFVFTFILSLVNLERLDEEKRELERTRNLLETVIYESREKLDAIAFVKHTTEQEREDLSKVISAVNNWYDEEGYTSMKSVSWVHIGVLLSHHVSQCGIYHLSF